MIDGQDAGAAVSVLGPFGLGFLIPLLCLIIGTGAIGPEIDDGSIVYLLAKPLSRHTIVRTKLAVCIAVAAGFGALPVLIAGFVIAGGTDNIAIGYAIGALVAGIAYCTLFLLLAILTRNAVVTGLLYALIWEGLVGSFVPGAQALSIQQWALSITTKVIGTPATDLDVTSAVGLSAGIVLLVVLAAGATTFAGVKLRSIRLTSDE